MKKMVLVFGLVLFFSISFQVNAQNFFPTKQGDIYQLERVTIFWIDPYYDEEYRQSVANEVTVNNKTFVWAWDNYYRLDTTENKLFILLNNEEKLAFDFNKQAGDIDSL